MIHWIKQIDDILRGDATDSNALEKGQLNLPLGGLSFGVFALGALSGLCIGSFALFRALWSDTGTVQGAALQMLASAVKLPFLFLLTLLVTLPSLYVFSALGGSRLSLSSVWRLLLAMLTVMLTVLASLGPIIVFFGASTDNYAFMKLLNVVAATVAGVLGLAFLLRTLHRLVLAEDPTEAAEQSSEIMVVAEDVPSAEEEEESGIVERPISSSTSPHLDEPSSSWQPPASRLRGPLASSGPTDSRARSIFQVWLVVFAVVGAQMSWVLRPFIGAPELPFSWFRSRQSNFFLDVLRTLSDLFGG